MEREKDERELEIRQTNDDDIAGGGSRSTGESESDHSNEYS
jgi:hypothetical protein